MNDEYECPPSALTSPGGLLFVGFYCPALVQSSCLTPWYVLRTYSNCLADLGCKSSVNLTVSMSTFSNAQKSPLLWIFQYCMLKLRFISTLTLMSRVFLTSIVNV